MAPISWTYIIIAEMINKTGGLGAMGRVTREFSVRDRFEGTLVTGGLNYLF